LAGGAVGALLGSGRVLHAQQFLGLRHIAGRFLERLLAVHHARTGLGAQRRNLLCRNLFHCRHGSFHFLVKTPPSRREARGRRSVVRATGSVTPPPPPRSRSPVPPGESPLPSSCGPQSLPAWAGACAARAASCDRLRPRLRPSRSTRAPRRPLRSWPIRAAASGAALRRSRPRSHS